MVKNVFLLFLCLTLSSKFNYSFADDDTKKEILVVIDPGHGGKDYGRLASKKDYLHEKGLNLVLAKKLGKYIAENMENVKIIYTRTDDTYPSLTDRVNLANSKNADYFISVHCNGVPNKSSVVGTETHIDSRNSKKSLKYALIMEKEFSTRAGRISRGIKTSADRHHSLQVLKDTKMPSILIEAGFMSNPMEEKYLNSSYGQEILASAMFRAFRTFVKSEHKDIDFDKHEEADDEEGPYYRVQIMSSIDEISIDIPEFKKLDEKVTRIKVDTKSMYKYKYVVGKTKDKKAAKKIQKKVREKGFKDAFVVYY